MSGAQREGGRFLSPLCLTESARSLVNDRIQKLDLGLFFSGTVLCDLISAQRRGAQAYFPRDFRVPASG